MWDRTLAAPRNELESTEHALVDETQLGAVVEIEQDSRVAQLRILGPAHPELPAHPQVGNHGVITQDQPEVFTTTGDGIDTAPLEVGGKTLRTTRVGTHEAAVQDRDRFDGAPEHVFLQPPTHHLNLGKFRHLGTDFGRPRGRPAARRVSCWMRPPSRRPFRRPWR